MAGIVHTRNCSLDLTYLVISSHDPRVSFGVYDAYTVPLCHKGLAAHGNKTRSSPRTDPHHHRDAVEVNTNSKDSAPVQGRRTRVEACPIATPTVDPPISSR